MARLWLTLVIVFLIISFSMAELLVAFTSSNLPIIIISTRGQNILDETKIEADMGIIHHGDGSVNYVTDACNVYNGIIGIELRGSSSQNFPKKQYAVETRDSQGENLDVSLLGMPEENDWVLNAPYSDKSLIRNALVYTLSGRLGRYAPRVKLCELVLNGDYRGVYLWTEKIKRSKGRTNISKLQFSDNTGDALTGGYILKIDKFTGSEVDGWYSPFPPYQGKLYPKVYIQYHYPKPSDITNQQRNYIYNYLMAFESVLYGMNYNHPDSGYYRWIDMQSWVDFFLINELFRNVDGYRLSAFFYKDRDSKNSQLIMGPVWDFDLAAGNADYYNGYEPQGWQFQYFYRDAGFQSQDGYPPPFWWSRLTGDSVFMKACLERWNNLKTASLSRDTILNVIDSMANVLSESQLRNFDRWKIWGIYVWPNYFIAQSYTQEINYMKSWLSNRWYWMDQNLPLLVATAAPENSKLDSSLFTARMFPNPFGNQCQIQLYSSSHQSVNLKCYDILGRLISQQTFPSVLIGENQWLLDTRSYSFPAGKVFFKLTQGTSRIVLAAIYLP